MEDRVEGGSGRAIASWAWTSPNSTAVACRASTRGFPPTERRARDSFPAGGARWHRPARPSPGAGTGRGRAPGTSPGRPARDLDRALRTPRRSGSACGSKFRNRDGNERIMLEACCYGVRDTSHKRIWMPEPIKQLESYELTARPMRMEDVPALHPL